MHYIKQPSLAGAIWRSSFVYFITHLSCFAVAGFAVYGIVERTLESTIAFGIAVGISLSLWILNWFMADRCNCQLCQANLMRRLGCGTHPAAKRLFWSFRFRIACSVLATRTFRCPYCGEGFNLRIPNFPEQEQMAPPRRSVSLRRSGKIPPKRR